MDTKPPTPLLTEVGGVELMRPMGLIGPIVIKFKKAFSNEHKLPSDYAIKKEDARTT
jgi:hypothetical protein